MMMALHWVDAWYVNILLCPNILDKWLAVCYVCYFASVPESYDALNPFLHLLHEANRVCVISFEGTLRGEQQPKRNETLSR